MAYRDFMPMAEEWTAERARALPDDGKRYEVLDWRPTEGVVPMVLDVGAVFREAVGEG